MGKGLKTDRIDTPKIVLLVMAELFTVASLVAVIMDGEWTRIALTAVTLLFVPLPLCIEYLFRKKLTLLSFGIGIAYSIGPMLGHAYNLYTILPWWDKMLHIGLDLWLGLDTQTDTVIHTIVSATLGRDAGIAEPVTNINDVIVGGRSLGLGGYLDIGLIDTMHDLMIESIGAVIAAIPVIVRKGRHTVFRREK